MTNPINPFDTFMVSYEIGENKPGAPLSKMGLVVNTDKESVSGAAQISQTTNPPFEVSTILYKGVNWDHGKS